MRRGQTRYGHVFSKGKNATAWVNEGSWRGTQPRPLHPIEEVVMGGPDRLGDVLTTGGGRGLTLRCSKCGHSALMPKDKAIKTFGYTASPMWISNRIKCSKCGSKQCYASA